MWGVGLLVAVLLFIALLEAKRRGSLSTGEDKKKLVLGVLAFVVTIVTLFWAYPWWTSPSEDLAAQTEAQSSRIQEFDPAPGQGLNISIKPGEIVRTNNFGGNNQYHMMFTQRSGTIYHQINGRGEWLRIHPEEAPEMRLPRGEILRFVLTRAPEEALQNVTLRASTHKKH